MQKSEPFGFSVSSRILLVNRTIRSIDIDKAARVLSNSFLRFDILILKNVLDFNHTGFRNLGSKYHPRSSSFSINNIINFSDFSSKSFLMSERWSENLLFNVDWLFMRFADSNDDKFSMSFECHSLRLLRGLYMSKVLGLFPKKKRFHPFRCDSLCSTYSSCTSCASRSVCVFGGFFEFWSLFLAVLWLVPFAKQMSVWLFGSSDFIKPSVLSSQCQLGLVEIIMSEIERHRHRGCHCRRHYWRSRCIMHSDWRFICLLWRLWPQVIPFSNLTLWSDMVSFCCSCLRVDCFEWALDSCWECCSVLIACLVAICCCCCQMCRYQERHQHSSTFCSFFSLPSFLFVKSWGKGRKAARDPTATTLCPTNRDNGSIFDGDSGSICSSTS